MQILSLLRVGGTVGDIESLPFLEAIRQMGFEEGKENTCYIHLTLLPWLSSAGELKNKTHTTFCERIKRNWDSTRYFIM